MSTPIAGDFLAAKLREMANAEERREEPAAVGRDRVLAEGRNCWRVARASRFAVIMDAADYFRAVKAAMLAAERRIMLIGWDFDTGMRFEPQRKTLEGPNRLGRFLTWLPRRRPELQIYLLKWDLAVFQALGRGMTPLFVLNWITNERVHLELDGSHPIGAAHHQKIAVIDDALAFCGGIDMTAGRWDTREHPDRDRRRHTRFGKDPGPWHDATTAVDGEAARALGDLARERWRAAKGETLEPIPEGGDLWPADLAPLLENVEVGIARTLPEIPDEQQEVREVESLYLDAIGSAERSIYLESQYLASRRIAEALAARLREPNGPEAILVLPRSAEGWLEQKTMDSARHKLLRLLWSADRFGRFGVFYPVAAGGRPIYVHAKIMVIDDRLLRVGSSNLNNRSLGFDSECDLAIEAEPGSEGEGVRDAIRTVRGSVLSEHLGVEKEELERAVARASGSLLQAIEALRGSGRTLERLKPEETAEDESVLAENELLDPERTPPRLSERLYRVLRGASRTARAARQS